MVWWTASGSPSPSCWVVLRVTCRDGPAGAGIIAPDEGRHFGLHHAPLGGLPQDVMSIG